MQEQHQKAEGGPVGFSSNEQQQFVTDQQEAYNYTMGSLYVGDLAPEVRTSLSLSSNLPLVKKFIPTKCAGDRGDAL